MLSEFNHLDDSIVELICLANVGFAPQFIIKYLFSAELLPQNLLGKLMLHCAMLVPTT
jgi:hypothetical protein